MEGSGAWAMTYTSFFRMLTGHDPYPYQRRVASALLGRSVSLDAGLAEDVSGLELALGRQLGGGGASVVLQAPTGSGKTLAAVVPFVFSRVRGSPLADRVLYALPLRSLAEGLYQSTKEMLGKANLLDLLPVRLQTGETSGVEGIGDPSFAEGRVIFCTIDQVLSSYLNIPFSLSARQANLNAGALVGSLVVFDEYHLLDPGRSLRTAILLSQHLAGLTSFVWMTATQAEPARRRLFAADRGNAVPVTVPADETTEIPSQQGEKRRWVWRPGSLDAEVVWREHQALPMGQRRTLVVCNTVCRSQRLCEQLSALASPGVPVRLLHSRFLAQDRADAQRVAAQALARGSSAEMILVATQVVEAGLDLSAACLHTELAPANALVQRAGRCARFEGEKGIVFVYDSLDSAGRRSYQPYAGGALGGEPRGEDDGSPISSLGKAMDRTAIEVAKLSGQVVPFQDELALINRVHSDLDLVAIESFDSREWRRRAAEAMTPVPDHSNYGLAADLIRDVDSVSVFLSDDERLKDRSARLAPRYRPAVISVPRNSLAGLARTAVRRGGIWGMQAPRYADDEWGDGFRGYEVVAEAGGDFRKWLLATYRPGPLAVNPVLGRYTEELGLQLGVASRPGDWLSTGQLSFEAIDRLGRPDRRYQAETFEDHVRLVALHARALCGEEATRDQIAREWRSRTGTGFALIDQQIGLARLDARYNLPQGTTRSLAVLAAELHDAGKLAEPWQQAVWRWQALKASSREQYPEGLDGGLRYQAACRLLQEKESGRPVLLAHTDYDSNWRWPDGRQERDVERGFPRPNHALEGAWLALPLIAGFVDRDDLPFDQLVKAVLAAISQHHSPGAGLGAVSRNRPAPVTAAAPGAVPALCSVLGAGTQTRLEDELPSPSSWENFLITNVRFGLKPGAGAEDDWAWWPLAMALVRIIRLADQHATELAGCYRIGGDK